MKKIFTFVVLTLIFFSFNNNAFSIEADVFVQSTVNRAAKTLGGGLTKEERIEKLKEIAKDTVDITGIGFYSLGKHRKNLPAVIVMVPAARTMCPPRSWSY